VANESEMRSAYKIIVENLKERDSLQDVCVDGMIVLKWIFSE
jgi:hypothetical protein